MCTQKLVWTVYWTSESLSHFDLPGPWASVTVNQVNLNPSIITPPLPIPGHHHKVLGAY